MAGKASVENGKKGGRPKGSKASHTLDAALFRKRLVEKILKRQDPIIDKLISSAVAGNMPAIKEILERTLGRVSQPIDLEKDVLLDIQNMIIKISNEQ